MLTRALGPDQDTAASGLGAWPDNYAEAARRLTLTAGREFAPNERATRASVALFDYQMLFTDRRLNAAGEPVEGQPTMAFLAHDTFRAAGLVAGVDTHEASVTLAEPVQVGPGPVLGPAINLAPQFAMVGATHLGDFIGHRVQVYIHNREVWGLAIAE